MRKAQTVRKRKVVAIRGDKALLATLTARTVMDLSAKSADLRGRVDSMALP